MTASKLDLEAGDETAGWFVVYAHAWGMLALDADAAPAEDVADRAVRLHRERRAHAQDEPDYSEMGIEPGEVARFEAGIVAAGRAALELGLAQGKLEALTQAVEAQLASDEQTAQGAGARAIEAHARIQPLRAALDAAKGGA
jgi:hypothetical protein